MDGIEYIASKPGIHCQEFMEAIMAEAFAGIAIPAEFIEISNFALSHEDRVMLELKIELKSGWGHYRR